MKALGTAMVLIMWSVVGACLATEINEWRREKLERHRRGSWVAWLAVNRQIVRMR